MLLAHSHVAQSLPLWSPCCHQTIFPLRVGHIRRCLSSYKDTSHVGLKSHPPPVRACLDYFRKAASKEGPSHRDGGQDFSASFGGTRGHPRRSVRAFLFSQGALRDCWTPKLGGGQLRGPAAPYDDTAPSPPFAKPTHNFVQQLTGILMPTLQMRRLKFRRFSSKAWI